MASMRDRARDRVERLCERLRTFNGQLANLIGQVQQLVQGIFSFYKVAKEARTFLTSKNQCLLV